MNTFAYFTYLFITYIITVNVGLRFYRNGRIFILQLLGGDERLTEFINRLLLIGYYLLNLGYAAFTISQWQTLTTWTEFLVSICTMTGRILLILAVMHQGNIAAIYMLSKRNHLFINHKK